MPGKFLTSKRSRLRRISYQQAKGNAIDKVEFPKSYIEEERRTHLDTASWFWGNLSSGQAEYLLHGRTDGTFVVRNSSEDGFLYCITYKLDGRVASLCVFEENGVLSLNFNDPTQVRAATLHGLIAKLLNTSVKRGAICKLERSSKAVPLKLTSPVNRLSSLKAHCRRVLRMTSDDEILCALPLPKHLKSFLLGR